MQLSKSLLIKILSVLCILCCALALVFGISACSDGADGAKGDPGPAGPAGVGISKVEVDNDGNVVVYYTDGSSSVAGKIPGPSGSGSTCDHANTTVTPQTANCKYQINGFKLEVCADCGYAWLTDVVAWEDTHDYVETETKPTCTEDGYTSLVCSICGDEKDKVIDAGSATGHTYGTYKNGSFVEGGYIPVIEAGKNFCEEGGAYVQICKDCNTVAYGYAYGDGHVVEKWNVSINEDGTVALSGRCSICNSTINAVAPKLTDKDWSVESDFDDPCDQTVTGTITYTYTAATVKAVSIQDSEKTVDVNVVEGSIVYVAEKATAPGHKHAVLGYQDGWYDAATGVEFNEEYFKATGNIALTCEDGGAAVYYICEICNEVIVINAYVPHTQPTGAGVSTWIVGGEGQNGIGASDTALTAALAMVGQKDDGTVGKNIYYQAATCSVDGYRVYVCSECGNVVKDVLTVDHEYEFSYDEASKKITAVCANCGDTYSFTVKSANVVETVEATCDEDGYEVWNYVDEDGKSGEATSVIKSKGHNNAVLGYMYGDKGWYNSELVEYNADAFSVAGNIKLSCATGGALVYFTCADCNELILVYAYIPHTAPVTTVANTTVSTVGTPAVDAQGNVTIEVVTVDKDGSETPVTLADITGADDANRKVIFELAPTCDTAGKLVYFCSECGHYVVTTGKVATGHDYANEAVYAGEIVREENAEGGYTYTFAGTALDSTATKSVAIDEKLVTSAFTFVNDKATAYLIYAECETTKAEDGTYDSTHAEIIITPSKPTETITKAATCETSGTKVWSYTDPTTGKTVTTTPVTIAKLDHALYVDNTGKTVRVTESEPVALDTAHGMKLAGNSTIACGKDEEGNQNTTLAYFYCLDCGELIIVEVYQPHTVPSATLTIYGVPVASEPDADGNVTYTVITVAETDTVKEVTAVAKVGTVYVLNATCTTDGAKYYYCTECGEWITEEIKATGHDIVAKWNADQTAVELYCSVCSPKTALTTIPEASLTVRTTATTVTGTCLVPTTKTEYFKWTYTENGKTYEGNINRVTEGETEPHVYMTDADKEPILFKVENENGDIYYSYLCVNCGTFIVQDVEYAVIQLSPEKDVDVKVVEGYLNEVDEDGNVKTVNGIFVALDLEIGNEYQVEIYNSYLAGLDFSDVDEDYVEAHILVTLVKNFGATDEDGNPKYVETVLNDVTVGSNGELVYSIAGVWGNLEDGVALKSAAIRIEILDEKLVGETLTLRLSAREEVVELGETIYFVNVEPYNAVTKTYTPAVSGTYTLTVTTFDENGYYISVAEQTSSYYDSIDSVDQDGNATGITLVSSSENVDVYEVELTAGLTYEFAGEGFEDVATFSIVLELAD